MEEFILNILIALFNSVTSILIAQYFFSHFSRKKEKTSFVTILSSIIFFLMPLIFPDSVLNIIVLILCTFLISFNYEFKLYNKIVFTLVLIALNVLVEIVLVLILSSLFKITVSTMTNGMFAMFGTMFSKLMCIIFCYIIGTVKNKTLIGEFRVGWMPIYVLPVATFLVTCSLYFSAPYYEGSAFLKYLSSMSLVLLIISNMLIIRMINRIHETSLTEMKLDMAEGLIKQQEKQYHMLLEKNEAIIKIRHDNKNFIAGLLGIVMKNGEDNRELKDVLENRLRIIEKQSYDTICGNNIIDTIVNYKILEAQTKGVHIEFRYKNIQKIEISNIDLAILLGNAIDNAVEASEKLTDNKLVEISIKGTEYQTVISITNYVVNDIDTNNLKSSKGYMHGYGIMNMESIVSKNGGTITFSCKDQIFATIIILNNK